MKTKMSLFLLLLIAICFLSVFSCMAAANSVIVASVTAETSSHTYRYSRKYITDIEISIPNVVITFYTQPHQEEIVVQVTGGTIEGAETEKLLSLYSDVQTQYGLDIYLPERFYNVKICGKSVDMETFDTMRGTMEIQTDALTASLHHYCGGISFVAKEGSVSMEDGNLQKASTVTLLKKGNIYLHTKISDRVGISSFYTKQGAVKVQTNTLESDTFFEVSAVAVSGEYQPLSVQDKLGETCRKVQIVAEDGIVYFIN